MLSLQLLIPDTEQSVVQMLQFQLSYKRTDRVKELNPTRVSFPLQLAQILKFAWP